MTDPNRKLSAISLAVMVDRQHGIATYKTNAEGKTAIASIHTREALEEDIAKLIYDKKLTHQQVLTEKRFYEERPFTREDFAASWKTLDHEEKQIWSNFVPDFVLKSVGVKADEIKQYRAASNDMWDDVVHAAMGAVKELSPAALQEMGFSEAQIRLIPEFLSPNHAKREIAIGEHREEAMGLARDVVMAVERERPGFLKEILEKSRERDAALSQNRQNEQKRSFREIVSGETLGGHHRA